MLPTASQPSAWSFAATAAAAAAAGRRHASSSQQKYAHLQVNARPAEPSIAITKLARQGRTNEALAVYLQLIQEGGFPSRESLYQLTRALYKSSNLQGMVAIRDTLIAHYSNSNSISSISVSSTSSLAPRPASKREARSMIYTYTMLINLMAKHKLVNLETIRLLCKEMSQFTTKTSIVLYNTLIKTLLETNQPSQAHAIFEDLLISTTLSPTISTYTILMKDASVRKQYGRLLNYLNDMQSRDITITYALGCARRECDTSSKETRRAEQPKIPIATAETD
ncbi:hypothetical protein [Parasitella parasitica]|uniref:Pentacotripeptide-repeat region of PRORP domain-containing protein n=1 Tax=Parasitella parasitica TaxID=35722 RepID=A0A0B7NGG6_9FUNG|nr:hypothetical protein [Parasitella parasitica]